MEKFILHLGVWPEDQKVERVHAVLVTADGRILLRYKNGAVRKVTGGHIDPEDKDMQIALKREVLEELNCKIDRCDYLGYLEYINEVEGVHENWARMVARVSEIGPAKPDPDRESEWIYGRTLATPEFARKEPVEPESFVQPMAELLEYALKVAQEQGYFTEPTSSQNEVINEETCTVDS